MDFAELGMKLSLPYNFSADFIERVLLPNVRDTEEVYLPVFWTVVSTGRSWIGPERYDEYRSEVDRLYAATKPAGVRLAFLANDELSVLQTELLIDEALRLQRAYPDSSMVLTSLDVAARLRRVAPALDIMPSTLALVNTCVRALYWRRAVNPRTIVADRIINRRPDVLRSFKRMGFRLKVIPQDSCIPDCPVTACHRRDIHLSNQVGALTGRGAMTLSIGDCRPFALGVRSDPTLSWLVPQKEILPAHLPNLRGLVDVLKIEGRTASSATIVERIEYFREGTSLRSRERPYYEEPPEAWEKLASCDRSCGVCDWCERNIRMLPTPVAAQDSRSPETGAEPPTDTAARRSSAEPGFHYRRPATAEAPEMLVRVVPLSAGMPYFLRTRNFAIQYQARMLDEPGQTVLEGLAASLSQLESRVASSASEPEWRRLIDEEAQRLGLDPA